MSEADNDGRLSQLERAAFATGNDLYGVGEEGIFNEVQAEIFQFRQAATAFISSMNC